MIKNKTHYCVLNKINATLRDYKDNLFLIQSIHFLNFRKLTDSAILGMFT